MLAGFLIIERVGRRPLILWCTAVECVSLIIVGGLGSGPMLSPTVPPPEYGKTAIAFICIYVFAFNVSCAFLDDKRALACASIDTRLNRHYVQGVLWPGLWLLSSALDPTETASCRSQPASSYVAFLFSGKHTGRLTLGLIYLQWITAFAVAFTLPYLYDPGSGSAGLGVSFR